MYWLDTTILAVVGIGAAFGALSGLLMQLARLVGFVVALYAAIYLNDPAADLAQRWFVQEAEPWVARIVAYVGIFLLIYLAILFGTLLLERGMKGARLQTLNRLLGALLGATKAGLILGAIFLALRSLPSQSTQEMVQRSTMASLLAKGTENLVVVLVGDYQDKLRGGVEDLSKAARPVLLPEGIELPE
ncbi:MAG: CvpA family protein [Gemmataceae bacterium]|nr:CvpA family protein [Gemmataceae bacterium]